QALGLTAALLAAARSVHSPWSLAAIGIVSLAWMVPRHKLFDSALPMIAVAVGAWWLEQPGLIRCLIAGLVVGGAFILGKNHGLYVACAYGLLLVFQLQRPDGPDASASFSCLVLGFLVGVAPLLVLMLRRGFLRSYVDSYLFFLRQGRTNSAVPIPWPWRAR